MLNAQEQQILDALESRAAAEDVEIVTVEIVRAHRSPTVRVYIDTPTGVGFDELSSAQTWIGDVIEVIDPFPGAYHLEVSSPGIDRPLRTTQHFQRFVGEKASVKTLAPHEGRSAWTGIILEADDEHVTLSVDGEPVTLRLDELKRAHLIGTLEFNA